MLRNFTAQYSKNRTSQYVHNIYLEKACGLVMYFIASISFFSFLIWFRQIPSRQSEENEEGTHEKKTCFPHMKLVFTFIYIHKMFCGFYFSVLFRLFGILRHSKNKFFPTFGCQSAKEKSESVASICPFKLSFALCVAPWKIEC